MCTKCAGRISLDSINEKTKQTITTTPIVFHTTPNGPETINIGENAAIVVSTPNVAGMATFFTPAITLSALCPFLSISEYADSPMIMASSTTIPSTNINAKSDNILMETPTMSSGITNSVPRKQTGNPTMTQKASLIFKNSDNTKNTSSAPKNIFSSIMLRRSAR